MGTWEVAAWTSDLSTSVRRRDRRSGHYHRYVADRLVGAPVAIGPDADRRIAQAERQVRSLGEAPRDLAGIARFLLRSEAIASSRIEGIAPSARQVALAELGQTEDVAGVSEQARLVANNMTVVRDATTRLVEMERVTSSAIVELHQSLLPSDPSHHGLREVQNWIGGSNWHPLEAEFVPPAPTSVPSLMLDLADYLSGAQHSPIIQAALAHAQFETIHPFTDGNGRVGRALIHTVLARRGLAREAVLPISMVLATLQQTYIDGLTSYRQGGPAGDRDNTEGWAHWIDTFAEATLQACAQATRLATELNELRVQWDDQVAAQRRSQGAREFPRKDSATALLLADLPGTPVMTIDTATRIHGISHVAASRALEELRAAGILTSKSVGPRRRAYVCEDILETITWAERRLASTQFDTRIRKPHDSAPAVPRRPH